MQMPFDGRYFASARTNRKSKEIAKFLVNARGCRYIDSRRLREQTLKKSRVVLLVVFLAWGFGAGLGASSNGANGTSAPDVRLEAHDGQTQFKIGDPVIVDLVFSGGSPGYIVRSDMNLYQPSSDLVDVVPEAGWARTHRAVRGQGLNGNAMANLGSDPIRVPVLLNRTITFLSPGHYEVTLTTERLRPADASMKVTSLENCEPCRTTNAIGIDILTRDKPEEEALVGTLSRELEETKPRQLGNELSPEQKEEVSKLSEELRKSTDTTDADKQRQQALLKKIDEVVSNHLAAAQMREDARREAAMRLAYLPGDDALRAKVHFLVAEGETGEAHPIGPIMRDGIPSSHNKQLQLTLLQSGWRDPNQVPTYQLQTALRQAKELVHGEMANDDQWAGTDEERKAALEEYQGEINEIIATLPLRSEQNRAETVKFLKAQAVPNAVNQAGASSLTHQ